MRIRTRLPELSGSVHQIPEGVAGIRRTVETMRALIREGRCNPIVRANALNLVALQPPRDRLREIECVFQWVRDYIRYVDDVLDTETLATPEKTIELAQGDCDDKTILLCSLLESIGIRTMLIVTGYSQPNVYEHVYCAANAVHESEGEIWIGLDATQPYPAGWQPPNAVAMFQEPAT